ncbi:hypothetical protein BDZ45DRAFT_727687 [Acephala macrosclerotiorum]|nr:hypothetical protein BDZ45DRAFT_727687 [Acephala macrosclerotiorum]
MPSTQTIQLIFVPHRPTLTGEEIYGDLAASVEILLSANGLKAAWRGRKFEDRYTLVYLVLWDNLESSHAFFTSAAYKDFNTKIQPALNGRKIKWAQHAHVGSLAIFDDMSRLKSILSSPAIEVALTKVVEGGVAGYYEQFEKVVAPILNKDPGCDGYFISSQIENPQDQLLLINWKSVGAHHEKFEKKPEFKACIDALFNYYAEFVVPWHIVGLELLRGSV